MGVGAGFGKTILIGDQFVRRGVPAIVSSIPYETVATVKRIDGEGWTLEDNRVEIPGYKEKKGEQQIKSIDRILKVMSIDVKKNAIEITFGGTLLAGSGIGASAASCVSLARALNEEFNLGLSIGEINQVAWEGEFAYHEVVLGNSGVTADTSALGGIVDREKERDPALFLTRLKTITEQALELKKGLEVNDLERVGEIMSENHKILIEMGLSHEKLIYLCDLALEKGAWGAKLTGGGMGGYMVALTPGKDLQERVATAIEKEGFAVIRATVG